MDGSASYDNAVIVSYVRDFVYDTIPVELYGMSTTFTFWITGTYDVTLTVVDASGNVYSDTIVVKVDEAPG